MSAVARVSVVVPVYDNATTLGELATRLDGALDGRLHQLIFVNDACPGGSATVLSALAAQDQRITTIELPSHRGQQAALLEGLRHSDGDWVVVMDADLQDPPEAIPVLLEAAGEGHAAAFAGRRGRYESSLRLLSGRSYRALMSKLTGLPADAGGFVVLSRPMVEQVLALRARMPDRPPVLGALIGASGLPVTSVPVVRQRRPDGRSGYTWRHRVRVARHGVGWALVLRRGNPVGRGDPFPSAPAAPSDPATPSAPSDPATPAAPAVNGDQRELALERHNEVQRRYFGSGIKSTMVPRPSRYVDRQLDEVLRSVDIRPGEQVLEVGCGMGRYTLPLRDRGVAVEGLDLSPYLLDHLGRAAGDRPIPLHCADVLRPPEELIGRFDAVVGLFALHHMHDIPACLESMGRLLRPGGRAAFCEPNPYNPLYYVQMAVRPGMTWQGDGGIVKIRRRPLSEALESAGFRDVFWTRFGFFPPVLANGRLSVVEPMLEAFPPWRVALPFQLFGGRLPRLPSAQQAPGDDQPLDV